MGLKEQFEKYEVIKGEDVARGIVYAWTAMVVADDKVAQEELEALERFARIHNLTQPFNSEEWLGKTVGEALSVYKTEGMNTLFSIIEELLANTTTHAKQVLLYSLMEISCVDEECCDREIEVLNRMVELLDISRQDVLMMGMLFATYKPAP